MKRKSKKISIVAMLSSLALCSGIGIATITANAAETPLELSSFTTITGASIRTVDPMGIRYTASISKTDYEKLEGKDYEFGMAFVKGNCQSASELKTLAESNPDKVLKPKAENSWSTYKNPTLGTATYEYTYAIYGLTAEDYNTSYMALAYVEVDGELYFSSVETETATIRTPLYVAVAHLNSDSTLGVEYVQGIVDTAMTNATIAFDQQAYTVAGNDVVKPVVKVDGKEVPATITSKDTDIVKVEDGKLVSVAVGTAQIEATIEGKENTYTCTADVTIESMPVREPSVDVVLENQTIGSSTITQTTENGAQYLLATPTPTQAGQYYQTKFPITKNVNGYRMLKFEMYFENGLYTFPRNADLVIDSVPLNSSNVSAYLINQGKDANADTNMLVYETESKKVTGVMYTDFNAEETSAYAGKWLTVQYLLPENTNTIDIRFEFYGKLWLRNVQLTDDTQFVLPDALTLDYLGNSNQYPNGNEPVVNKANGQIDVTYDDASGGIITVAYQNYGYTKFEGDFRLGVVNKWLAMRLNGVDHFINGNNDASGYANLRDDMQVRLINADGSYGALVNPDRNDQRFQTEWVHVEVLIGNNAGSVAVKACDYKATAFSMKNLQLNKEVTLDTVTEMGTSYANTDYDAENGAYSTAFSYQFTLSDGAKTTIAEYKKLSFDVRFDQASYFSVYVNATKYPLMNGTGSNTYANMLDNMQVCEINADGTYGPLVNPYATDARTFGRWFHVEFDYSNLTNVKNIVLHRDGSATTIYIKNVVFSKDATFTVADSFTPIYGEANYSPVWDAEKGVYHTNTNKTTGQHRHASMSLAIEQTYAKNNGWSTATGNFLDYKKVTFDIKFDADTYSLKLGVIYNLKSGAATANIVIKKTANGITVESSNDAVATPNHVTAEALEDGWLRVTIDYGTVYQYGVNRIFMEEAQKLTFSIKNILFYNPKQK